MNKIGELVKYELTRRIFLVLNEMSLKTFEEIFMIKD
jgi:hypothetical protein